MTHLYLKALHVWWGWKDLGGGQNIKKKSPLNCTALRERERGRESYPPLDWHGFAGLESLGANRAENSRMRKTVQAHQSIQPSMLAMRTWWGSDHRSVSFFFKPLLHVLVSFSTGNAQVHRSLTWHIADMLYHGMLQKYQSLGMLMTIGQQEKTAKSCSSYTVQPSGEILL